MKKVFLVVSVLLLVACGGGQRGDFDVDLIGNPQSAAGYDTLGAMPVISFDHDLHDFGRLSAGESISYSFHFRNTGSADLIITSASATCGCTVASYPKERIAPGGEGYVTVTFKSAGKAGQQYQEVTLMTNAQPATTTLRITARVGA